MSKRYSEEELRSILGQELEGSQVVNSRIEEVYHTVRKAGRGKKPIRRWMVAVASTAAIVFIATAICISNPVLAAKIPIMGNIFGRIEGDTSYKGDFSKRAIKLAEDESTQGDYVQESGGIKVTVTEASYGSMALYLAIAIESEEGFPSEFNCVENMKGYVLDYDMLFLESQGEFDFTKSGGGKLKNDPYCIEGKYVDEHTFTGIIRIEVDNLSYWPSEQELEAAGIGYEDYEESEAGYEAREKDMKEKFPDTGVKIIPPDQFTYNLNITDIFGLLFEFESNIVIDPETGEEFDAGRPLEQHYPGTWNFSFEVSLDTDNTKVIEVNDIDENGLGIEKVTKTAYEIKADIIVPEGEEWYNYIVSICDANGEVLESQGEYVETYSVYERDLSKITVYICDEETYMNETKGINISKNLPQKALYQKELVLE